jgi:hypothetical protein
MLIKISKKGDLTDLAMQLMIVVNKTDMYTPIDGYKEGDKILFQGLAFDISAKALGFFSHNHACAFVKESLSYYYDIDTYLNNAMEQLKDRLSSLLVEQQAKSTGIFADELFPLFMDRMFFSDKCRAKDTLVFLDDKEVFDLKEGDVFPSCLRNQQLISWQYRSKLIDKVDEYVRANYPDAEQLTEVRSDDEGILCVMEVKTPVSQIFKVGEEDAHYYLVQIFITAEEQRESAIEFDQLAATNWLVSIHTADESGDDNNMLKGFSHTFSHIDGMYSVPDVFQKDQEVLSKTVKSLLKTVFPFVGVPINL